MKHTPASAGEEGEIDRIGCVKERTQKGGKKSLDNKVPCVPAWTEPQLVVTQAAEVSGLIKYTASLGLLAPLWDSPWGVLPPLVELA